jgi:hypothetical protein
LEQVVEFDRFDNNGVPGNRSASAANLHRLIDRCRIEIPDEHEFTFVGEAKSLFDRRCKLADHGRCIEPRDAEQTFRQRRYRVDRQDGGLTH